MFTEKIKNSLDSIKTFLRIFNKHEWTSKKSKPTFRERFFLFIFFCFRKYPAKKQFRIRNNPKVVWRIRLRISKQSWFLSSSYFQRDGTYCFSYFVRKWTAISQEQTELTGSYRNEQETFPTTTFERLCPSGCNLSGLASESDLLSSRLSSSKLKFVEKILTKQR